MNNILKKCSCTVKKAVVVVCLLYSFASNAQNLQLHYDFGRDIYSEESDRPRFTATIEQYKADGLGSWFYFVDLDINSKGTVGAYAEISREFNIGKDSPFAAHIEYDGGLNQNAVFQPSALVGAAYNGHSSDFSSTYSVQLLYKQYFKGASGKAYGSVQITGVWNTSWASGKLTFCGFIDLWRECTISGSYTLVAMTEPQIWYNVSPHFSFGSEVEISNNFIFNPESTKSLFVNPTLAVKFTL